MEVGMYRLCRQPASGRIIETAEHCGVPVALYDGRGEVGLPPEWRILDPVEPIPVDVVTITRAEGRIDKCITVELRDKLVPGDGTDGFFGQDWVSSALNQATVEMQIWGRTAPERGRGYDKCDFTVRWADGSEYGGRFDLQRGGTDDGLGFRDSLMHRLRFYAGMSPTPRHMYRKNAVEKYSDEEARTNYMRIVDSCHEMRDFCRHVLAKCAI